MAAPPQPPVTACKLYQLASCACSSTYIWHLTLPANHLLAVAAAILAAVAADFRAAGFHWYGVVITHHNQDTLFIPQALVNSYCTETGAGSESKVSKTLERLPYKCVRSADAPQMQHFRQKGCAAQNTTRLNLLSLSTTIRLARALHLPQQLIQDLQTQEPAMPTAPPTSPRRAAAARTVGLTPAAALASLATNRATAAAARANRASAATQQAAALAPAIQAILPVNLPVVALTEEELHCKR